MSNTIKIATFNLRSVYDTKDGVNSFVHRAGMILDKINTEKPDIICAQEAIEKHFAFLKKNLTDYMVIYNGRKDNFRGEGLALLIRRESLDLVGLEAFWLSPTPYTPGSRFEEQSGCARICQVGTLQIAEGTSRFYVYNVHLDHMGEYARVKGIAQVLDRIKEDNAKYDFPLFLLGDFNATPESEAVMSCKNFKDVELVDTTKDTGHTFHRFGNKEKFAKIDYIFADKNTAAKVKSVDVWNDEIDGIYLSDHYPLCITVEID